MVASSKKEGGTGDTSNSTANPTQVPGQHSHLAQACQAAWSRQQPPGTLPKWAVLSSGVRSESGNGKERSSDAFCACVCVKLQLLKATATLGAGKVQKKPGKVWESRNREASS